MGTDNRRSEQWTIQEVDQHLEIAMHDAYDRMARFAKLHNCDYRRACYAVALRAALARTLPAPPPASARRQRLLRRT